MSKKAIFMSSQSFNKDLALLLAKLDVESYVDVAQYDVSKFNMELVSKLNNEKTDIQGFVAKENKNMYIAFRGANTVNDYLRDLDVFYKAYPPSKRLFFKPKVHMGFFTGYESVKPDIVKAIQSNPDIENILITGHSMGAALAVYCAFDMNREFKTRNLSIILYTFGCPEVGNGPFVNKFKKELKNSYRVVNDEDIVAKINIPGLTHVPTMVLLNGNGITVNPSKAIRLKESLDDPIAIITGEAVKDHLSKNYVKALENIE